MFIQVGDQHVGTLPGECQRHRPADAAVRTGDDRFLAREPARATVALFPMVIMTMTVERLSIILMERGMKEALSVSLGTLLVSLCTYVVMSIRAIEDFMFAFPECLFALIGIQIVIGRYTGYRLSEYVRFAAFRKT